MEATNQTCISFYYHMYGGGIGTLTLYTKDNHGVSSLVSLLSQLV